MQRLHSPAPKNLSIQSIMKSHFVTAILAAIAAVNSTPLGEPSTLPGLIGRELGLRAAPGCSVGACGGQPPRNVVCCGGWACVNASAGGKCFQYSKNDVIQERTED
ncbi:hypothetical protein HGRIS_003077 [Hohenbuehelia grisea]|uniref:Uncharacterized protein n=1 Tax=Hohenbuehelia grisea TaxID=104357 RepID=A0ABR3JMD1_9AGAR